MTTVKLWVDVPPERRVAAAQQLAGDGYRVVPADFYSGLARENDDLRKQLHDAEVQAARPEPVDPADVRVGDHVEIEAAGGSWMVRGEVANTDLSYVPPRLLIHVATADPCWLDTRRTTMRLLRRAEPQPDPEQVKALAAIVRDLNREAINLTPNEVAERLVRRGVVVRDEH